MSATDEPSLQHVTDSEGRRTAVILPIEEYDKLLEDVEDLAVAAERKGEPGIPHEKVIAELKRDEYMSD